VAVNLVFGALGFLSISCFIASIVFGIIWIREYMKYKKEGNLEEKERAWLMATWFVFVTLCFITAAVTELLN